MPSYPFSCRNGHNADIVLPMSERDSPQKCIICGNPMQRKPAAGLTVIWGGRWRDQWRDASKERGGLDDGLGPMTE